MMSGKEVARRACASLASAALLFGAGHAAAESAPRRAGLLPAPPAVLAQLQTIPRASAPVAADPDIFPALDAPPVVDWLAAGVRPAPPEAETGDVVLDLAWALVPQDRRDLAAALDVWVKATPAGPAAADRRRLRAALADAYTAHGYEPFWRSADGWREAATAALQRLRGAGEDGLDLRDLALPAPEKNAPDAEDELALSEAVGTYALQAGGARIDPQRLSRLIGARPTPPEPASVIATVAAAGAQAGEVLQQFNPPHYGYQALRAKLAELRAEHAKTEPASDQRLAEAVEGASQNDAEPPLGRVGRRRAVTLAKASTSRIEAEVLANMERWRWLPRDLGDEHVEVNIPDFELAVVRDGQVAHRARIIVGKEQTPTPVFSNAVQFIIVNPYWNVPPSIINKEMLPKAGGDVSAIEQHGFKVSYRHGKLIVRQPPGERNALGRIKFMFPNDFAVYLHDTPSRGLFSASHRAFSHGCMRVEAPFALAEAVLGPGSGWSEQRVRRLIGGSERYINLSKPLPIHIEYFTAYVDEAGRLVQRPDLYGYSARVRRALGLDG